MTDCGGFNGSTNQLVGGTIPSPSCSYDIVHGQDADPSTHFCAVNGMYEWSSATVYIEALYESVCKTH